MAKKPDHNPISLIERGTTVKHTVRPPLWGWVVRTAIILTLGSQFVGCTVVTGVRNYLDYNTECDNLVIGWRDHVYSRRAFNRRINSFPATQFPNSFREGFIAGYHDVANGGKGCPPSVPPRKFWSWKYQTAEGQCKVNEWFAGYPYGAKAAEEDGIGNYRDIQISSELEALLAAEGKTNCPDCGPQRKTPTPLSYPDGEDIEPGNPLDTTILPYEQILPVSNTISSIRPASYVLERLPPTQPPKQAQDERFDSGDEIVLSDR